MKKEITLFTFLIIGSFVYLFRGEAFTEVLNHPPKQVRIALNLAGDNKDELMAVITHYKNTKQQQKLEAAYFLIRNMLGRGSKDYQYIRNGIPEDIDSSMLENLKYEIQINQGYFREVPYKSDLKHIKSQYLIENIDMAFSVWKSYSWCQNLPFQDFCRKILPYRLLSEPLSDWRKFYYLRHRYELDSLNSIGASQSEVCFYINQKYLRSYLKSAAVIPGDFSHEQFEKIGGGTCGHLAHNAVLVMRACGIPLNFDIVCYHGRINGGHVYNSLADNSETAFIFFSPYEREPERREWRAHRIMRLNFDYSTMPILDHVKDLKDIPDGLLKNPYYTDVTSHYFPVTDLRITLQPDDYSENILYLCTYNRKRFQATAWSTIEAGLTNFKGLTKGLLYFPMFFRGGKLIPAAEPFILRECDDIIKLSKSDSTVNLIGAKLFSVKKNITQKSTVYSLYYWKNGWVYYGDAQANDIRELNFNRVPKGTLYLLEGEKTEERIQRPFSYINEKFEYW